MSAFSSAAEPFQKLDSETIINAYGPVAISGDMLISGSELFVRNVAWVRQAAFSRVGDVYEDTVLCPPYIFVREGTRLEFQQTLTSSGKPALGRNLLAVADWYWGRIQIWERVGTNWSITATLSAADSFPGQEFGGALDLDGNTLVVGAILRWNAPSNAVPSAYVFARTGTQWVQQAKLTASPVITGPDTFGRNFGASVAISGDTVVAGDPRDATGGTYSGAAYVFARDGTNWSLQQKIVPANGRTNHRFGTTVALLGNTLLVGSPSAAPDSGAAYVYGRDGSSWVLGRTLTPSDNKPGASFGSSVAIGTNALVVANAEGRTYVYEPEPPLLSSVYVDDSSAWIGEGWWISSSPFTIHRIGRLDATLTVRYQLGGSAENDSDYERLSGTVTFLPGESSVEVPVSVIDDGRVEPDEIVTLSLVPEPDYVVGYPATGAISIDDNDWPPAMSVTASDPTAFEPAPSSSNPRNVGAFTIARYGNTNDPVTVYFSVSGTASTNDYQPIGTSITLPAGVASRRINVAPLGDSEMEGHETVVLSLSSGPFYRLAYPNEPATVVIEDHAPWQNVDIGPVGATGTGTRTNDTYTVRGSGDDIFGGSDAFHYYYRRWQGDGTAIVRVTNITQPDLWALAGLMFRAHLDPNSPNAFMFFRAGDRTGFQSRSLAGQNTTVSHGRWGETPSWLKLVRRGNSFVGYESFNGTNWRVIGTANNVDMPDAIYLGFAVTSHRAGTYCRATFDSLHLSTIAGIPHPPGDLKITVDRGGFLLSWKDSSVAERGFVVEQVYTHPEFQSGSVVRTLPADTTHVALGPFIGGQTNSYRVAAIGSLGNSAYSDIVTGSTPPISFIEFKRGTNEAVEIKVAAGWNQNYVIESSTNLVHWTQVTNLLGAAAFTTVTNYSKDPARFYRAILLP